MWNGIGEKTQVDGTVIINVHPWPPSRTLVSRLLNFAGIVRRSEKHCPGDIKNKCPFHGRNLQFGWGQYDIYMKERNNKKHDDNTETGKYLQLVLQTKGEVPWYILNTCKLIRKRPAINLGKDYRQIIHRNGNPSGS